MSHSPCISCKYAVEEDGTEYCSYQIVGLPRAARLWQPMKIVIALDGARAMDDECPCWALSSEARALQSAMGTAEAAKARRKG